MLKKGQGVCLKLDFWDGGLSNYKRPFLVIDKNENYIHLLNISSTHGKEHKLGMKSNKLIRYYNPPFLKSSFVKLDAMYIIPNGEYIKSYLLCGGRAMRPDEFKSIENCLIEYRESNKKFNIKKFDLNRIEELNKVLCVI